LEHKKLSANKTPAPKNFWPYSYQFYICNPIKVFEARIINANNSPDIEIPFYLEPDCDRSMISSLDMPISLLTKDEIKILLNKLIEIRFKFNNIDFKNITIDEFVRRIQLIPEEIKEFLPLRDSDKMVV